MFKIGKKEVCYILEYLDKEKHFPILNKKQIKNLRRTDKVEIEIGETIEWKR